MIIKSKQIIDELELSLGKFIEDITNEDLNTIQELTINGFDIDNKKLEFYLEDLLPFNNLKRISFNNIIVDVDTMNYIFNSNIEELNLYNCELLCDLNNDFKKIKILRVEYTSHFEEEYLKYFPNVKKLSYKGYTLKNVLPDNIKVVDLMNTKIEKTSIIDKSKINEIFISKEEYDKNKKFYDDLIIKVNVYDENNCYLLGSGDKNE